MDFTGIFIFGNPEVENEVLQALVNYLFIPRYAQTFFTFLLFI